MRKRIAIFLAVSLSIGLLLSVCAFAPEKAVAATGGWHLVNTKYHISTLDVTVLGGAYNAGGGLFDTYTGEGSEGNMRFSHSRRGNNGKVLAHRNWQVIWDTPSAYLAPNQKTGFNAEVKVISFSASWGSAVINASFDAAGMTPSGATAGIIRFQSEQGETTVRSDKKVYLESSKVIPEGRPGDKKSIYLAFGDGYGYIYEYEWRESAAPSTPAPATPAPTTPVPATPAPATPTTSAGSGAEVFESGSRIMWHPASGLGYRLFRSTSQSSLGISVTDFYITGTSFADVNVEPNTTYYYTVKPVLAEARPFEGIEEKLGPTIATFTVKTGSQVYKPGSFKHFILMKLGSPYMSVDGVNQEIDPGRGTQPLVISGRTMVPIRAVVEAMDGTVTWDASTQKITLSARGNQVEMWLNKKDIKINGTATKMDVPPISQQGRTFVPLRFAAENLNCKVDWINSTKEAVTVYED